MKKTETTRRQPRTGSIWLQGGARRAQAVRRVCEALERAYGRPRHGNVSNALDELIYIILSNRTSIEVARRTLRQLKRVFPAWEGVLANSSRRLQKVLGPAGLSVIKSRQIRAILMRVRRDFGVCDLRALKEWPEAHAEAYLVGLPGVSTKVARCVMMYALGAAVLPVDAHVHRIAGRLGWIKRKRADQSHEELDALVPPERRHLFHVACISHGRAICRSQRPACDKCCLKRYCAYYRTLDYPI